MSKIEKLPSFVLRLWDILKVKTAPRWLVLAADMVLVSVVFWVLAMSDVFARGNFSMLDELRNWVVVMVVYSLMTIILKSHARIIRLSMVEDLYRETLVVVLSTVILCLVNIAWVICTGLSLMSFTHILLLGFTSVAVLLMERLTIKHFYILLSAHSSDNRRRVLVMGTSLQSLLFANALRDEIGGKYVPVGLLTLQNKSRGEINGFKVYGYDPHTIKELFAENRIHALMFGYNEFKRVRNVIASDFIKNNLRILMLNHVDDFDPEEENKDNKQTRNISTSVKQVQIEDLLCRDTIKLDNTLVRSHIKGSCVLVTGACGSIGSEIVRQLAAYKAGQIVLVDQAETPMHDIALELREKFPQAKVEYFVGDVQNKERMRLAFETFRPKYVFHAAAYKHVPMMELNPTEAILTNVQGSKNIADLALEYDVFKFVMVSTDKAVNPSNVMGCTKRLAEIYTQSLFFKAQSEGRHTQFITTRFGNVLGSNGSVIPIFRRQIAAGGPVTITHHDIIRYFMTIPEACSLVLEAGCMGKGGEIYIFDMGQPVKIYDLATRMISLAGLRPGLDIEIKEIGLRPGEKLYEELLNQKETTMPTDNDKIMIAKVRTYDFTEVEQNMQKIIDCAQHSQVHQMVKEMKLFVPEFKSRSSAFEAIDREIEAETGTPAQQQD